MDLDEPGRHHPSACPFGFDTPGLLCPNAGAQGTVAAGQPVCAVGAEGTARGVGLARAFGQVDVPVWQPGGLSAPLAFELAA
ncbi:hypothetical protein [Actinocorallia populi]|uniref:hypothetical protein n=1 Tax=Actinocorallia populi TaxID=2079200 RepID=UPI00130070E2|nr:hypothetical protein [Actinocorallia populi]